MSERGHSSMAPMRDLAERAPEPGEPGVVRNMGFEYKSGGWS